MGTYDEILEARKTLWEVLYNHYINIELFSVRWMFLLSISIISYLIWLIIVDKSRLKELLLVGSLATVFFTFFDVLATTRILWSHKIRIFPSIPSLFATDYTLYPVIIMITTQFCTKWKKYLIWAGVSSAFLAFVVFPLYIVVGTMILNRIKYFHVFLVAYIISIFVKVVFDWVTRIEQRNKTKS